MLGVQTLSDGFICSVRPREKSLPSRIPRRSVSSLGGMSPRQPALPLKPEGQDSSSPVALVYRLDHAGMFLASRIKPN